MQQKNFLGLPAKTKPPIDIAIGKLIEKPVEDIVKIAESDESQREIAIQALHNVAYSPRTTPEQKDTALATLRKYNRGMDLALQEKENIRQRQLPLHRRIEKIFED